MKIRSYDEIAFSLEHGEFSSSQLRHLIGLLWKRIEKGLASPEENDLMNRAQSELDLHFPRARNVSR